MLLSSPRNTLTFALGCLAVTIALMDDDAPNRLVANADQVTERRLAPDAALELQTAGAGFARDGGPWQAAPDNTSVVAHTGAAARTREIEPVAAPVPVQPANPGNPARSPAASPAPIDGPAGRLPVAGVRERSAPLGRSYADDGSRNLAEDLRAVLG